MDEVDVKLSRGDMQMVILAMQMATLRMDEKFGAAVMAASSHQAGVPQGPSCGEGETSANVVTQQET